MNELKLGAKWPPKLDKRTIKLRSVLSDKLPIPASFDAERDLIGVPFAARMFCNNQYGCCVISAQANLTRVLEYVEQGKFITISDDDVRTEYLRQSGGADTGLYMLDAFNEWHKTGWNVVGATSKVQRRGCWNRIKPQPVPTAGQHLDIYAFAALDAADELRMAVKYLRGAQIAVSLPKSAFKQFNAGEPWHVVNTDTDIAGGHCVNVPAYLENGNFECWTWGKRQQLTEEFYLKYRYDNFAVVDGRDKFLAESNVDVEKLETILNQIKNS